MGVATLCCQLNLPDQLHPYTLVVRALARNGRRLHLQTPTSVQARNFGQQSRLKLLHASCDPLVHADACTHGLNKCRHAVVRIQVAYITDDAVFVGEHRQRIRLARTAPYCRCCDRPAVSAPPLQLHLRHAAQPREAAEDILQQRDPGLARTCTPLVTATCRDTPLPATNRGRAAAYPAADSLDERWMSTQGTDMHPHHCVRCVRGDLNAVVVTQASCCTRLIYMGRESAADVQPMSTSLQMSR